MVAKHFRCQVTPSAYRRRFWSPERGWKEDPWSIRSDTFALVLRTWYLFAHHDLISWHGKLTQFQTRIFLPTVYTGNIGNHRKNLWNAEMAFAPDFWLFLVVVSNKNHKSWFILTCQASKACSSQTLEILFFARAQMVRSIESAKKPRRNMEKLLAILAKAGGNQ